MAVTQDNQTRLINLKFSGWLLFVFFLFAAAPTFAQEKQDIPTEDNYRPSSDELNPQFDNHANKERETLRDSIVVRPATTVRPKNESSNSSNNKKAQDETLGFNVLYFIIQKFKVSEIIN